MKRKRVWIWVAVMAIVGLVAATAGSAGARVPSQTTKGVTSSTINVAGLVSKPTFAASVQGAQARFDRENAKGGVFGRKIKIVDTADDKFDPTTNVQETRRVVSSDNVFAMVPTVTVVLGASDYLAQQKVPFFGWGISSGFCGNDYGYGFTGCVAPKTPDVRQHLHARGGCEGAREGPEGSDRGHHRRGHRCGTQRPRHPRDRGGVARDEGRLLEGCRAGAAGDGR